MIYHFGDWPVSLGINQDEVKQFVLNPLKHDARGGEILCPAVAGVPQNAALRRADDP